MITDLFLQHVGEGQNLLLTLLHCGVTLTHPWILSEATETQLTLNVLLPIHYFRLWIRNVRLTFTFQEYVCFGQLGRKDRILRLFHVCFQSSKKCEKIICFGELRTPPLKSWRI